MIDLTTRGNRNNWRNQTKRSNVTNPCIGTNQNIRGNPCIGTNRNNRMNRRTRKNETRTKRKMVKCIYFYILKETKTHFLSMLDAADEHNIVMAAARKHGILMLGDAAQ
jgi:hypothetical protein